MTRIILLLCVGLAAPGCDRGVDRVDSAVAEPTSMAAANPVDAVPSASTTVSASYLAGPWCYLYYSAGDERGDKYIDYVFNEDGTLLFQNNSGSAVDRPGTWKLDGTALLVDPALWVVARKIDTVAPDRFVLGTGVMRLVFARGECAQHAS